MYRELTDVTSEALLEVKRNFTWVRDKLQVRSKQVCVCFGARCGFGGFFCPHEMLYSSTCRNVYLPKGSLFMDCQAMEMNQLVALAQRCGAWNALAKQLR